MATTTTISETFSYTPLKGSSELRLLTINPGDGLAPIVCYLSHADLSDPPYFEALSYCWGPPSLIKHIVLDSHKIRVRDNLWSALWHLRNQHKKTVVWVDALCINQHDVSERNHQVRLMKDVYQKANCVVAWLGPSADDSDLIMDCLYRMPVGNKERRRYMQTYSATEQKDLRQAWRALCVREYWNRTWIIQECVHGASLMIRCGNKGIDDWNKFLNNPFRLYDSSERAFGAVMSLRGYQNVPENLLGLIDRFIDRKCMDTRDTVYALLSMASDRNLDKFHADYGKSIVEVYCDVFELYAPQMMTRYQFRLMSYPHSLGSEYPVDEFGLMLFSQILRKILHVESRSFPNPDPPGSWREDFNQTPVWSRKKRIQEPAFGLEFLPLYDSAKRSLLQFCPGEEISEAVMDWLLDNSKPVLTEPVNVYDFWPLQFPQRWRQLSKLQLFVGTFAQFSSLSLELWNDQIIINVLHNPPSTRQRVVMERASGYIRLQRGKEVEGEGHELQRRKPAGRVYGRLSGALT